MDINAAILAGLKLAAVHKELPVQPAFSSLKIRVSFLVATRALSVLALLLSPIYNGWITVYTSSIMGGQIKRNSDNPGNSCHSRD